ncbi:MAG: FimV domain-containing protein, partial [Acinetobacter sp.]|nr:FimV domain-containing protein [Acinetobacter sp.]
MTVYNKLKIAILTIITTPHLYAITLDPLQIQSAPGELLYAEMNFHHTNPNSKIEVGLATPEDVMMLGTSHRPPANLNFFTRRNSQGEGTIVITSSRPMIEAELNIILKIQEGGASHLKHIRQPVRSSATAAVAKTISEKPLAPKFIVSEKDIALNLPESTRFNTATNSTQPIKQEKLLNAPFVLPPSMANSATDSSTSTTPTNTTPAITALATPITQSAVNNFEATLNAFRQFEGSAANPQPTTQTAQSKTTQQQTKHTTQAVKKKTTPTQKNNGQKHVVQRQESLWSISQQIASQTQQPVAQVMKQIKAQNEHAFIDGNANRLRQGARLNFDLNTVQA